MLNRPCNNCSSKILKKNNGHNQSVAAIVNGYEIFRINGLMSESHVSATCPCGFHCHLAVGHQSLFGNFNKLVAAVGGNHLYMIVVDECHEFYGIAVSGADAPAAVCLVEIESNNRTIVLRGYGIAFTIAFHEIFAILTVDHCLSLCYGV